MELFGSIAHFNYMRSGQAGPIVPSLAFLFCTSCFSSFWRQRGFHRLLVYSTNHPLSWTLLPSDQNSSSNRVVLSHNTTTITAWAVSRTSEPISRPLLCRNDRTEEAWWCRGKIIPPGSYAPMHVRLNLTQSTDPTQSMRRSVNSMRGLVYGAVNGI